MFFIINPHIPPSKFNIDSSPLKNGGWKTILSYWVSVTFQGRTVKLREGNWIVYRYNLPISWVVPLPRMPVTTRNITFLVGNPYKPSLATGILRGEKQPNLYHFAKGVIYIKIFKKKHKNPNLVPAAKGGKFRQLWQSCKAHITGDEFFDP